MGLEFLAGCLSENINRGELASLLIYISIGCCGYSGKVLIIFLATATHPAVTNAGKKGPQSGGDSQALSSRFSPPAVIPGTRKLNLLHRAYRYAFEAVNINLTACAHGIPRRACLDGSFLDGARFQRGILTLETDRRVLNARFAPSDFCFV